MTGPSDSLGSELVSGVEDALRTMAVVEACYESRRAGRLADSFRGLVSPPVAADDKFVWLEGQQSQSLSAEDLETDGRRTCRVSI